MILTTNKISLIADDLYNRLSAIENKTTRTQYVSSYILPELKGLYGRSIRNRFNNIASNDLYKACLFLIYIHYSNKYSYLCVYNGT